MEKIKVVLYGVGAVGSLIAKHLLQKKGIEIVGAIDVVKEKVGKDLGEVLGIGKHVGVIIFTASPNDARHRQRREG